MTTRKRRMLVVDDSAVVREVVGKIFGARPDWIVEVAADAVLALERIREQCPDVILLDLEMPRMDGLTFLRHLMATEPIPVVVCSGHASHGSDRARAALELGAVEIFPKAKLGIKSFLEDSGEALVSVADRAARTPVSAGVATGRSPRRATRWRDPDPEADARACESRPRRAPAPDEARASTRGSWIPRPSGDRLVLLGASMGGPDAIRKILARFPAHGPPCVILQHMLDGFEEAFARRLNAQGPMRVKVAAEGDYLEAGQALIAPGGRHLVLDRTPAGVAVRLDDGPSVKGHRPSVDVLFASSAQAVGRFAVGGLLTGMGADGAQGLLALRRAGATTLVQDEGTSVVFGMPMRALTLDAADEVVPLDHLAERLLHFAKPPSMQ